MPAPELRTTILPLSAAFTHPSFWRRRATTYPLRPFTSLIIKIMD
jgi:hypothetical protein